jgi:hypothetical protein
MRRFLVYSCWDKIYRARDRLINRVQRRNLWTVDKVNYLVSSAVLRPFHALVGSPFDDLFTFWDVCRKKILHFLKWWSEIWKALLSILSWLATSSWEEMVCFFKDSLGDHVRLVSRVQRSFLWKGDTSQWSCFKPWCWETACMQYRKLCCCFYSTIRKINNNVSITLSVIYSVCLRAGLSVSWRWVIKLITWHFV